VKEGPARKRKLKQREKVRMDEKNGRKKENQSLEQNIYGSG
jgi:hypothetical protein